MAKKKAVKKIKIPKKSPKKKTNGLSKKKIADYLARIETI